MCALQLFDGTVNNVPGNVMRRNHGSLWQTIASSRGLRRATPNGTILPHESICLALTIDARHEGVGAGQDAEPVQTSELAESRSGLERRR